MKNASAVLVLLAFLVCSASAAGVFAQNGSLNATGSLYVGPSGSTLFVNSTSGFVGIGTANSTRPLHIAAIQDANIRLQDTSGASPAAYIEFYNDTTRWGYVGLGGYDDKMVIGTAIEKNLTFYTNNTTKMTLTATGNLGIGTANPRSRLQVNDEVNDVYTVRVFNNGTGSNAGAAVVSVGNTGTVNALLYSGILNSNYTNWTMLQENSAIFVAHYGVTNGMNIGNIGPHDIKFWTGENERVRITSGGNVGIGTTGPQALLTLQKAESDTAASMGGIGYQASNGGIWHASRMNTGHDIVWDAYTGSGWVTGLVQANDGNVGVGIPNPSQKLTVMGGNAAILDDNDLGSELATTWTNGPTYPFDAFSSSSGSTIATAVTDGSNYADTYFSYSSRAGATYKISFNLALNNGTVPILTSCGGELGGCTNIGTVVSGNNVFYWSPASTSTYLMTLYVLPSVTSNFSVSSFTFKEITGGDLYVKGNAGIGSTYSYWGGPLATLHASAFQSDSVKRKEVVRVERVGESWGGAAGRTAEIAFQDAYNPTLTASIGGVRESGESYNGALAFYTFPGSGTPASAITQLAERMRITSAGNVGIGTTSPSYTLTVAGTAWVTSGAWSGSDSRWKQNVTSLLPASSLGKILALKPVNFEWKTAEYPNMGFTNGTQVGFIAQEVEKVIPEVVTTDDKGFKGMSYERLTPVLASAIQEQQEEIDWLKAELCSKDNSYSWCS